MAEFVEKRIEQTIPETEEMERMGLLSRREVRSLIQRRRNMEYRMAGTSKSKSNFIRYVEYECKLLDLLKIRRKNMGLTEKFTEIESAIAYRLRGKVKLLTMFWPGHTDVWELRLSLAKNRGWKQEVSKIYAEQVRFHANKEWVWVSWAKWEVEGREDFDKAREILLSRALLYHPNSVVVRRELFRLELLYIEYLLQKGRKMEIAGVKEAVPEDRVKVLNGAVARAVYLDSISKLPDPELYVELYSVATRFPFGKNLAEDIYRDLFLRFPKDVSVWKLKAKRAVAGITENEEEMDNIGKKPDFSVKGNLTPTQKIEALLEMLDKALEATEEFLPVYLQELLWQLFHCWGIDKFFNTFYNKFIDICEKNSEKLSPLNYLIWHQIVLINKTTQSHQFDIMKKAVDMFPAESFIQLTTLKLMLDTDLSDEEKLKEFEMRKDIFKGRDAVEGFRLIINKVSEKKMKKMLFEEASNSSDDFLAKSVRIHYLEWMSKYSGLKGISRFFKKVKLIPPFSTRLHSLMIELKLKKSKNLKPDDIRRLFETAVHLFGSDHYGLWLCYIEFEKNRGDPTKAPGLCTRAVGQLKPKQQKIFNEIRHVISERNEDAKEGTQRGTISVNGSALVEQEKESPPEWDRPSGSPLVEVLEEEPMLTYTGAEARQSLFSAIRKIEERYNKEHGQEESDEKTAWEPLLAYLLGWNIKLLVKLVNIPGEESTKTAQKLKDVVTIGSHSSNWNKFLDELSAKEEDSVVQVEAESDVQKLLQSSEVLKPEFMQKTSLAPYYVSRRAAKRERKKKRDETKGPGWFDMKAPEMTDEVKQSLEMLQMRSVLDPKRHYKSGDMKVLPKYFQMGKVLDNAADFYSSRVPKKERKRTLAEEIIHDEEVLQYQKRKYNEIVAEQAKSHKRHSLKQKQKEKRKKLVVGKRKQQDF